MKGDKVLFLGLILILSFSIVSAGWFSDLFGMTGNVVGEINATTIESLMSYGECKFDDYCVSVENNRANYLTNVIDGKLSTSWYPADSTANARITYPQMSAGEYIISHRWGGDSTHPFCSGKISVLNETDGDYQIVYDEKVDKVLTETEVTIASDFKYLKVEVGEPLDYCGWVGIQEIGLEKVRDVVVECIEDWDCSGWSDQVNDCGVRTCVDKNNCGSVEGKPSVAKGCGVEFECTDSDEGKNYYEKGEIKVIGIEVNSSEKFSDYCVADALVKEYYCFSKGFGTDVFACSNKCIDGACIETPSNVSNNVTIPPVECNAKYYCETEPSICPSAGIQIKECIDIECDAPSYTEEIVCNPGECSGCEFDEACIPFGFRKEINLFQGTQGNYKTYCEIGGELMIQKTVDSQGNWANCQNNYECESNICSSGECIEVTQMLQQANLFKRIGVRLWCRFSNPFSGDEYNSCMFDLLGDAPAGIGGGGGGGGGSSSTTIISSSGGSSTSS